MQGSLLHFVCNMHFKHIHFFHSSNPFMGTNDPNKLTRKSQLCGFIAQLVDHCTSIAEVMGLNPVEFAAGILQVFVRDDYFNCSVTVYVRGWLLHFRFQESQPKIDNMIRSMFNVPIIITYQTLSLLQT